MPNGSVLISGASVAGPALAWWLARRGYQPVIVEKSAQPRGGGYAVDFRGQAHLRVLRQMGLLSQIGARQTGLRSLSYVDEQGQPIAEMPQVFFAGDVEILRGDLAAILYQATRDDTEYIFGNSVASLDTDGDGVHVTFTRAAPRTSTWSSGPTASTRTCAGWPSDRKTASLADSACTCRSSPCRISLASTGPGCYTASPAGPPASSPRLPVTMPSRSFTSPRLVSVSTRRPAPSSSGKSSRESSAALAGRCPGCLPRCRPRTISTTTPRARSTWTLVNRARGAHREHRLRGGTRRQRDRERGRRRLRARRGTRRGLR